ncbi:MAG: hypothetical protein JWM80_6130 [Cyanobacteria bacterium RYN_339]|nr:hypothetical protein [Cyanobacteria bacterium RYN_339]
MRQMIPCSACGRHHHGHEAACPHCGAKATPAQGMGLVRNLKMGALLAFTAATTAACYGAPSVSGPVSRPSVESPSEKVPSKKGVAYMFVTPTGGATGKDALQMEKAKLDGTRLTIASVTVDVSTTIELPSLDKLKSGTTIDLKDLKYLYAKARYFQDGDAVPTSHDFIATVPGTDPVTGSLALTEVTSTSISGTLTMNTSAGKVVLYFACER